MTPRFVRRLQVALYVLCVSLLMLWLVAPLLWIVVASLQPESAMTAAPPHLDFTVHTQWYTYLMTLPAWTHSVIVSLETALAATALTVGMGSLIAYPLARLEVPFRRGILVFLIATLMVPAIVVAVPVLFLVRELQLTDTVRGLVLVNTAFGLPLVVWLLYGFFADVPKSIEQAARIDGCTRLGALGRVILPAAAPGVAATAVLMLISTWNEFLFALIIGNNNAVTVTRRMAFLGSLAGAAGLPPYTELATAGVLAVLPPVVLVIVFNRWIVAAVTVEGGVKG
jgi:multiple sugar transport system permease protein